MIKSLDSFDFKVLSTRSARRWSWSRPAAITSTEPQETSYKHGNSRTGNTHFALGLGLPACQKGLSVIAP